MRWMLCMMLLTLTGCAASPQGADPSPADEAGAAGAAAEAAQQTTAANRAAVVRRIEALPGVGAAQVSIGTGIGGGAAASVAVTVVRADGGPVDDALAQQVVERVVEVFDHVPPSNVAVRDGGQGGYLYIGDIGRLE